MILTGEVLSERQDSYTSKTGKLVKSSVLCIVDKDPVRESRCSQVMEYTLKEEEIPLFGGGKLLDSRVSIGVTKVSFFGTAMRIGGVILPPKK